MNKPTSWESQAPSLAVPLFKGMIDEPDVRYLSLLNGKNGGEEPLEDGALVRLLEDCPSIELIQDVRRALVSAGLALHESGETQSPPARPYSPEGCMHRVGPYAYRGTVVFHEMWNGELMPKEVRTKLSPMTGDVFSDCTAREVRATLKRLSDEGEAQVITDAYHVPRSQLYFAARKKPGQRITVSSPEEVSPVLSASPHLPEQFRRRIADVCACVGERLTKAKIMAKEEREEKKYKVLHSLSDALKAWHIPFDPEEWLAGHLRSDARMQRILFGHESGAYHVPQAGFPDRDPEA